MSGEFLKGFRALDLTDLSGQLCGRLLADLGMEVIKIEPPGGDPVRNLAPFVKSADGKLLSTTFAHLNAGKASKVLDLETDAGRAALRQLVETADVVIESFQPGELDAKGLGYKDLAAINPGIVMASISAFGQTGPEEKLRVQRSRRTGGKRVLIHFGRPVSGAMQAAGNPGLLFRELVCHGRFARRALPARAHGPRRSHRRVDAGDASDAGAHHPPVGQ